MTKFRIWAPKAQEKVEVEIDGKRHRLGRAARGYWEAALPALTHDADYSLWLDDNGPYPDPRAPAQPGGVFGPSRHVEHARFHWSDAGFRAPPLASAVIYELHVGTFTEAGTFAAATEKLAHLKELGITHVEVMPVNAFSGERGWGYDGVALFAVHRAYGGPDGFKHFVDACHEWGLAVILDVVYNHLGPAGNFLGVFGSYFTDKYKTPWGPAVNLDGDGSDEVRRYICDNARMWFEDYHVDGLRLDAVHAFQDSSAVHLLEQLACETHGLAARLAKPLVLIAESDLNDPRVVRSPEAGGYGLDAQWSDDFHHALHAVLTGERSGYYEDYGSLAALARALESVFVYDGRYSPHRGRTHGRPVGETARWRFLGYLQNHDQVGNRAQGDRSSAQMSPGRLKIGAALVLAGPFLPMIFQGEEWAARTPFQYFTDHQDPELAQAVREGRRAEFKAFGWQPEDVPDPQAPATFERSRLAWQELAAPAAQDMLSWHRSLIALRHKATVDGSQTQVAFDEAVGWLLTRSGGLAVACNVGKQEVSVPAEELWDEGFGVALASASGVRRDGSMLRLPPDSAAVLCLS